MCLLGYIKQLGLYPQNKEMLVRVSCVLQIHFARTGQCELEEVKENVEGDPSYRSK